MKLILSVKQTFWNEIWWDTTLESGMLFISISDNIVLTFTVVWLIVVKREDTQSQYTLKTFRRKILK